MRGELTIEEIEDLLHQQYIGRLGCHADELTYIIPIQYGYDGTYLYGHAYAGMKITMMQKNPKVCMQVDNIDSMYNWKSVIAWGDFELLYSTEDQLHVQKIMLNKAPVFPPDDLASGDVIAFRIRITNKTGRCNQTAPKV
ncbi:MAG: pyridoxamine 5'-phosphate oxidase family protein [Ferruginibacter sp.]